MAAGWTEDSGHQHNVHLLLDTHRSALTVIIIVCIAEKFLNKKRSGQKSKVARL